MNISLGYIKDYLAFNTAIILLILILVFKYKISEKIFLILLILVFIFDGIFTFIPSLHNYVIKF